MADLETRVAALEAVTAHLLGGLLAKLVDGMGDALLQQVCQDVVPPNGVDPEAFQVAVGELVRMFDDRINPR